MQIIAEHIHSIDRNVYGGKAFWNSWLSKNGFNTPPTIYIPRNYKRDEYQENKYKELLKNETLQQKPTYAVRSSSVIEDGFCASHAGEFQSFTDIDSLDIAFDLIEQVQNKNDAMGVMIQEYIPATYAGVVFSTNPNTGNKNEISIDFVRGNSENLLNGKESGHHVCIDISENDLEPHTNDIISGHYLKSLISISKKIEKELDYPVDIEWCIEKESNKIFIVQCRPITNLQFKTSELIEVKKENQQRIPNDILNNDKIQLRIKSTEKNVITTTAYLLLMNKKDFDNYPLQKKLLEKIFNNHLNLGFCEIILKPGKIDGKVIRYFSENNRASLYTELKTMLQLCFKDHWQAAIIFHELYDLQYMGIIRKMNESYLVEASYGGFIQKGATESTQYICSSDFKIVKSEEKVQFTSYQIIKGKITPIEINKMVQISHELLKKIIISFAHFLDEGLTVEFGISGNETEGIPYLIDYIDDKKSLNDTEILSGVVSSGKIKGIIRNLRSNDLESASIESHYYDNSSISKKRNNNNLIFVVDRPFISLQNLLSEYNSSEIGFIFKEAAILSHFCILLREQNIPAIISNLDFVDDDLFEINTLN